MKTYKQFISEKTINAPYSPEYLETVLFGQMVLESMEVEALNESELNENVKEILHKMGIHADKKAPGVLEYAAKFTFGVGKIIWYAMKGDKAKIKEIAKEFTKEALLDFLLKLDILTLHYVTEPIHIIDAVTGWHIGAAIKTSIKKADNVIKQIKDAIKVVKDKVTLAFAPKLQPVAINKLVDLEGMLGN